MGNSESTAEVKDGYKPVKKEPTFVEILQRRVIEVKSNNTTTIESALAELLTEEARDKDVLACVETILKYMVSRADKGECYFHQYKIKSALFEEAHEKGGSWQIPGFDALEKTHMNTVIREFSKRTGIPSNPNMSSVSTKPGFCFENPNLGTYYLTCSIGAV